MAASWEFIDVRASQADVMDFLKRETRKSFKLNGNDLVGAKASIKKHAFGNKKLIKLEQEVKVFNDKVLTIASVSPRETTITSYMTEKGDNGMTLVRLKSYVDSPGFIRRLNEILMSLPLLNRSRKKRTLKQLYSLKAAIEEKYNFAESDI